jgi:hypothetical protein
MAGSVEMRAFYEMSDRPNTAAPGVDFCPDAIYRITSK